ncbi:MAG: hypothetical protein GY799_11295, partial [Desulfobulbaceae bacterium]|nr:hypothetical protein [Desulfobulbaceae bacterium]
NGAEFRINTTTADSQEFSSISTLSDGGFIVTWQSRAQDVPAETTNYGIYAQRYNQYGQSVGEEFLVNNNVVGSQTNSAVAGLNDDSYVIAWGDDSGQDGDGSGIFMKIYDIPTNIPPAPTDDLVNTETTDSQAYPDVAKLNDGGMVVVWESNLQDGSLEGVYAQRYDANGTKVGTEFRVNTETSNSQYRPSVTALIDGGFVITWDSYNQDGSDLGVFAQRYDANGVKAGIEFQVNNYTSNQQNGNAVAALANGGFVIAWHSYNQDGDAFGVYAQRYDASGAEVGVEFKVNTEIANHQSVPSIAAFADGSFIIVWNSNVQDSDSYGIYAQRYDTNGNPNGSEFKINTTTTGSQSWASLTILPNGDFVITWQSTGQDVPAETTNNGIYGQIYNADGSINGAEFRINTTTADSQEFSSISTLSDGGFIVTWQSR